MPPLPLFDPPSALLVAPVYLRGVRKTRQHTGKRGGSASSDCGWGDDVRRSTVPSQWGCHGKEGGKTRARRKVAVYMFVDGVLFQEKLVGAQEGGRGGKDAQLGAS